MLRSLGCICLVALATGCVSAQVVFRPDNAQANFPRVSSSAVEVHVQPPPNRPFQKVGTVWVTRCSSWDAGVEALKSKAAEAGADGVVGLAPNLDWGEIMEREGGADTREEAERACPMGTAVKWNAPPPASEP